MSQAAGARRRRPAAALLVTALAVALGGLALALFLSERSGDRPEGALTWVGKPRVYQAPGLPSDRILSGTVRNDSGAPAEIEARSIRVVDARGRPLQSDGIFLGSFVRGIYGASRMGGASDFERRRTGRLARISPGHTRPITVAWRLRPGTGPAARVVYRGGSLAIPR